MPSFASFIVSSRLSTVNTHICPRSRSYGTSDQRDHRFHSGPISFSFPTRIAFRPYLTFTPRWLYSVSGPASLD